MLIFWYLAKYSNIAGELKIDMNGAVTTLTGSLNTPLDESSYNLDLGKTYYRSCQLYCTPRNFIFYRRWES
jgi:hypothetical protein